MKDNHVCMADAKESVAYINSLTSCPKCKTKIEKGEGCMAITCAVCKTNFWYNTGEKSEAGNHGQSKPVSLKKREKLSERYKEILSNTLKERIEKLESEFVGGDVSETVLTRKASIVDLSDFTRIREFSKMYSEYIRAKALNKLLGKRLGEIEKNLRIGNIDAVSHFLSRRRFTLSKIIVSSHNIIFVEEFKTVDSIADVCIYVKENIETVSKAIEVNGIVKEYFVEEILD
jgi:uncharacterized Zn finger protein (UPF0148 family)